MESAWIQIVPMLFAGAKVTLEVAALSSILALAISLAAGLCRLSQYKLIRFIVTVYVELFRGSSLLIQLFWLYFALPFAGIELPKLTAAVLAFGLNYGAYGSEVVRSSILAVPKGQWEAALALNMRRWQSLLYVILPQAGVRMLPPFGNLAIELIKGTCLVYFITLSDMTYQAIVLRNNYIDWTPEILMLLLLMYFAITSLVSFGIRKAERSMAAGRL
ncbi:ectoine/hydroxyectoine ABC transporter permease subunit EhuC [Paenibacillus piri]|uniref:Ectoine/hydroxyectoine ABC transporter permease subunit EhuC n=1 Tax=Paenibacillus piri TaxID=2547395 RepID=A0A4R5KNQ3_9BACL|nr:ectoine/hydroxyectoine ABC transporter permease subunit EhuC [Paenibacillus piri]TDF97196.1 ectoine/hydroxyectoine ABC transporter permease subunit EhuC [Paenibacillus piri]